MKTKQIDLRIHHFFDIIRAFEKESIITPHPHQHSFHKIANLIRANSNLKIKIKAKLYLANIDFIYFGNDLWHIEQRKKDVIKGLKYYSKLHSFDL